jgi:transcriptional regulator with XRE-family HTH domain
VSADAPEEDQAPFSAALTAWRERRGLSKKKLAAAMGFDASYLSRVEGGRMHAGRSFARKAEEELGAGGRLWEAWQQDPGRNKTPSALWPPALYLAARWATAT